MERRGHMQYFKNKKLKKELTKLTDEELIASFRICMILFYLESNDGLYKAIQTVLAEIHSRGGECGKLLIEEMEILCENGIITSFFVLQETICYELCKVDIMEVLQCQIRTNNLRSWIKFSYAKNLSSEISKRITDADVDKIEERLREAYSTMSPL